MAALPRPLPARGLSGAAAQEPTGWEVPFAACSVPGLVEQSVSVCPGAVPAPSVLAQGFTSSGCTPRPTIWAAAGPGQQLIPSTAEEG